MKKLKLRELVCLPEASEGKHNWMVAPLHPSKAHVLYA